ncbi:MAG: aldo/keto reductase [Nitrososphaerota archaeon]
MKYRRFGRLDWKVSALGFGCMRLPVIGEDRSNINEDEAIKMISYAIDHGLNYIDSAYGYHGGKSEVLVGKVLKNGYRDKVRVATKMPIFRVNSKEDLDTIFNEQLARLQTDHIDFYLLHGLNKGTWTKAQDLNVLDWAAKKIADGKIGYLGFSFHDEYGVLKEIIDGYDGWTFCQIQYNYIDTEYQAGTKGLKYAASKGLGVVVMEPIAGGMLAVTPPPTIQAIWDEAEVKRTPAEWALQWVWNHPEVSVVLSGMSTMEQVVENVKAADRSGPNTLSDKELELFSRVREEYLKLGFIGCTGCGYCTPCPQGVSIPKIFALYNEYSRKRGDPEAQQEVVSKYGKSISQEEGAKRCAKCGECEEKCPQHLPIRNLLTRAAQIFERSRQ